VTELTRQLAAHQGDARHRLLEETGGAGTDPSRLRESAYELDEAELAAEVAHNDAAPGEAAPLELGVVYQGDWRGHADGMSRHVREQARALACHLPLQLQGASLGLVLDHELHPDVTAAVGYLCGVRFSRTAFAVRHVVFNTAEQLRNVLCPGGARLSGVTESWVYRSSIIYTSWERDRVGGELVRELARAAEVWVPCRANRVAFVRSGLPRDQVAVVPYPYEPSSHATTALAAPRGSATCPSYRRFYNIGKWEPRKGQHELLGAFLLAFRPQERACLTIKTHGWGKWRDYPNPVESLRHWAADPAVVANGWNAQHLGRLVRIETARLSDAELAELHQRHNIYVSAGHGEAWDLPAFDARCLGNSLVFVGYGGPAEYTQHRPPHYLRIGYRLVPAHAGYLWEPSACWAAYELGELAQALRRAEPPSARWHPSDFPRRFSRQVVGRLMCSRILARLAAVDQELAQRLRAAGSFG
jgi:glycosyltransferase involved in cell wall biosynthesis